MQRVLIFKTTVTLFLLSFWFNTLNAQKDPVRFYAVSGGAGYFNPLSQGLNGGLAVNLDVALKLSDEIFSVNLNKGFSEQFFVEENYTELNITYGRALELGKNWLLEGHFGLGYVKQKVITPSFELEQNEFVDYGIGFPVRAKILLRIVDSVHVGLNPNLSLNGVQTYYSLHLILQYNF